jgi:hypothetical protein
LFILNIVKQSIATLLLLLPILSQAQEPATEEPLQFPQQMSARQLLEACASSSLTRTGRERRRYCAGFVSGVEEAVRNLQEQHKLEASVCLPEGVSGKVLSEAFIRYSVNRQKHMNRPAAAVVLEALANTWPCDQPNQDR